MRAEWRRRGVLAAGTPAPASSQQPAAGVCTVTLARGATTPGGAAGTMTVRNVGEPCRIANFTVPESRAATRRLEVVKAPAQGRLDIVQPNLVAYTPRPGFTGHDEFAYGGSGPGRDGKILPFNVRVSVQVLRADERLP
jgi:hypothetical protein